MSCRTCIGLDCDDGPALGTYSLQRVILPEVTSTSGEIAVAALGSSYGCLDSPYSANIVATGRLANSQTQWSVIGGSLPTGLTLVGHGNYATISGTPSAGGIYRFTVLAEASNGDVSARQITFPVYRNWVVGACTPPASRTIQDIAMAADPDRLAYCPSNESVYASQQSDGTVASVNLTTGVVSPSITVGTSPQGICYAPDNDRIYVCNTLSDSVSIINPSTNLVESTVSVGHAPIRCVYGNGKVFVTHNANPGDPALTVLSTSSSPSIISTVNSGVGAGEFYSTMQEIMFSSSENSAYGTGIDFSSGDQGFRKIDSTSYAELGFLHVTSEPSDYLIDGCERTVTTPDRSLFGVYSPGYSGGFPIGSSQNTLVAFSSSDSLNGTVSRTPNNIYHGGITYVPNQDRIYVTEVNSNTGDSTMVIYKPTDMTVEAGYALGVGSWDGPLLYVESINQIVIATSSGLRFVTP